MNTSTSWRVSIETSSRHEREAAYWDTVAEENAPQDGSLRDNPWKRHRITGRLLKNASWVNQTVLEIGIGAGLAATAMQLCIGNCWNYLGTDVSPKFVRHAKTFGLNAVCADVRQLPGVDGAYTRVIALDSLEHVHPDDRAQGYAEIARVTAQRGLLLINMPLLEEVFSGHDSQFDHRFGLDDLHLIERSGFLLQSYELYTTFDCEPERPYAFVVMTRQ